MCVAFISKWFSTDILMILFLPRFFFEIFKWLNDVGLLQSNIKWFTNSVFTAINGFDANQIS